MFFERLNPTACVLFSAIFWGLVWYPLRLLEASGLVGPWQMLVSFGVAYLVLIAFFSPHYKKLTSHWSRVLVLALAAGWANLGFLLAILDGTVVRVMLLFYLSPVWSAVLGHFYLGERIQRITFLTITAGLVGAALMLWQPHAGGWYFESTDWLALSAGFAFALTNVMTRDLQELNVVTKAFVGWSGLLFISLLLISFQSVPAPEVELSTLAKAGALGIFGFMVATFTVIYGVTHMPVQTSGVLLLAEIVAGGISAWWIAGETLSQSGWIGGGLIMISAAMAARYAK